jgi:hypothetical protein
VWKMKKEVKERMFGNEEEEEEEEERVQKDTQWQTQRRDHEYRNSGEEGIL